MSKNVIKARYWTFVLYPESMIDNWEDQVEYLLQYPFSYCIHDKDIDSASDQRKTHVHFLIAFTNTTTYSNCLKIAQKLQPSCNYVETVMNVRYMYNYLIHDTDDCRKKHKYLYDPSDRILCNNFDIGNFEQLSKTEKKEYFSKFRSMIINDRISNYIDFEIAVDSLPEDYSEFIKDNSAYFERLCRGNWYKYEYNKISKNKG